MPDSNPKLTRQQIRERLAALEAAFPEYFRQLKQRYGI